MKVGQTLGFILCYNKPIFYLFYIMMKTTSLFLIACLLCACGQKGALYLAPKDTPAVIPTSDEADELDNTPSNNPSDY